MNDSSYLVSRAPPRPYHSLVHKHHTNGLRNDGVDLVGEIDIFDLLIDDLDPVLEPGVSGGVSRQAGRGNELVHLDGHVGGFDGNH